MRQATFARRRASRAATLLVLAAVCCTSRLLAPAFVSTGRAVQRHLFQASCNVGRAGAREAEASPSRIAGASLRAATGPWHGALATQALAVEDKPVSPAPDSEGAAEPEGDAKSAGDAGSEGGASPGEAEGFREGEIVEWRWQGSWYKGEFVRIDGENASITIKWPDDGQEYACEMDAVRKFSPEKKARMPISELRVGMSLKGNVTKIMPYGAFVDIGYTSGGLVHASKIVPGGLTRPSEVLQIGEEVVVRVSRVRSDGAVELSMLKSDEVAQISADQVPIGRQFRGRVVKRVDYGIFVDVGLPRNGLVPTALMSSEAEVSEGTEIDVWVSQFREDGALELAMSPDPKPQVDVEVGRQLRGKVVRRVPYGIFVDAGLGKNSLVPTGLMKEDVDEIVAVGQEIDVWVSRVRSDGAVELSMFEVGPAQHYEVGEQLTGIVKQIVSYGAFIDVGSVKNSLVPLSKMGDEGMDDPSDFLRIGQEVQVWVTSVKGNGQLELTLVDPEVLKNEKGVPFSVGQRIEGALVKSIVPYGAILEVDELRGILPRSRMSVSGSESIASDLTEGQTLDVWVSAIRSKGLLMFSCSEPTAEESLEGFARVMFEPEIPNGTWVRAMRGEESFWHKAQVTGRIGDDTYELFYEETNTREPCDRDKIKEIKAGTSLAQLPWRSKHVGEVVVVKPWGAFVSVGAEVDGLVHKSRVAEEEVEDVRKVLNVGDKVTVWVAARRFKDYTLELSMVQSKLPDGVNYSMYKDIPKDQWFTGKVARIFDKSVTVLVKPREDMRPNTGSVHIAKMSTSFVAHPGDLVEVGSEVQVRIEGLDPMNRIQLTMLTPEEEEAADSYSSAGREEPPAAVASFSGEVRGGLANAENEDEDDYLI